MSTGTLADRRWWLALPALTTISLFLLLHPYRGIVHDGHLYTVQALNHLHPELYGGDVFLRFGSQDNYTLFSPFYATTIEWLGLEQAAAAITLCSILLFLAAAFMLARALLPLPQAWIVPLLLVLIPAHYGPSRIFHFIEEFVTPRQMAEALTLFSLLAWFKGRRAVAALLAAGSMLVHPIMGFAGVVFILTHKWLLPHWHKVWRPFLIAALVLSVALIWVPLTRWQFDAEWHQLVTSRLYLSVGNWNGADWGRIATIFATLTIASLTLKDQLSRVALAAIVACGALLLLAFIGGDLLRLVIIVQAQPWRSLWLATVLALLLLPPIYVCGWNGNHLNRCGLLLLAAAWATPDESFALGLAPLAVIATIVAPRGNVERYARLTVTGAWLALILIVLFTLADAGLALQGGLTRMGNVSPQLDRAITFSLSGVPPALVLLAGGYSVVGAKSRAVPAMLGACAFIVIALLVVTSGRTWTQLHHDERRAAFAGWRALIPPGSEVFWAGQSSDRDDSAFNTWLLLERPSFVSRSQASNALFSQRAAFEMRDRARSLDGLLPFWDPFRSETPELKRPLRLEPVCRNTEVRYIVTSEDLVDATAIPAPSSASANLRNYKLYICP